MYLSKRLVNGIINQFEIATFFCFFSFGRLLTSKTKKRSPEVICLIASGLLFLGAMA